MPYHGCGVTCWRAEVPIKAQILGEISNVCINFVKTDTAARVYCSWFGYCACLHVCARVPVFVMCFCFIGRATWEQMITIWQTATRRRCNSTCPNVCKPSESVKSLAVHFNNCISIGWFSEEGLPKQQTQRLLEICAATNIQSWRPGLKWIQPAGGRIWDS